ncbi:hypothetical protein JYP52_19740 [Nitratireductor aquibiodomus]|uniref:hypothetical protein n=1 Tax=Nitratireductor aquibiodomus TaxID=204799 RepID=UPI0019D34328|nr:hypothetical protein [Nitratireductor aquibiodomus]MBN7763380.1 hypothetical protein [Nitratireductor aquibiodomus]
MKRRSFLRFLGAAPLAGLATCAATPVVAQGYARTGLAASNLDEIAKVGFYMEASTSRSRVVLDADNFMDSHREVARLNSQTEAEIRRALKSYDKGGLVPPSRM